MSKEKMVERKDDTLVYAILKTMKENSENALKYVSENLKEVKRHVEESTENQIKIQTELRELYKAITEVDSKLEIMKKSNEYEIKEIKEDLLSVSEEHCSQEVKTEINKIVAERLNKKNLKMKIADDNAYKRGTLVTYLIVVFFAVVVTATVTTGASIVKENLTKQEVKK
jgi:septal ring factor EnvC (AmiA/AmiB activator)